MICFSVVPAVVLAVKASIGVLQTSSGRFRLLLISLEGRGKGEQIGFSGTAFVVFYGMGMHGLD